MKFFGSTPTPQESRTPDRGLHPQFHYSTEIQMDSNAQRPAFPTMHAQYVIDVQQQMGEQEADNFREENVGLTKREVFIKAAMQGLCARPSWGHPRTATAEIARAATDIADSTLALAEAAVGTLQ